MQKDQLVKSFIQYVSGEAIAPLDPSDALPHDIHDWNNFIWLDVGRYLGNSEKIRNAKDRSAKELLALFEEWRAAPPHFENDVEHELRTGAAAYIKLYKEYVDLIANGNAMEALLNTSVNSSIVETMLLYCFDESVPMQDRAAKLHAYFGSDHYKLAPYQWLSARMFALLKEKVWQNPPQNKEKAAKRFRSFFHDVDHIATYAPYCDAFFMDNAMAQMMRDPRIALEQRFGTKVFSISNWKQFLNWIEEVDGSLSPEHLRDLKIAYPESITDPMGTLRTLSQKE
ncbi:hypothetical protein U91I_01788 [alpha proteobacterium U9-1i]|nr:hypothetical protein U91I_01788 [alpha proteobacterium U9-1i]